MKTWNEKGISTRTLALVGAVAGVIAFLKVFGIF